MRLRGERVPGVVFATRALIPHPAADSLDGADEGPAHAAPIRGALRAPPAGHHSKARAQPDSDALFSSG